MLQSKASKVIAKLVFVCLLIAATVAFFVQVPSSGASTLPHIDKLVHFAVFFLLSLTLNKAFSLSVSTSFILLVLYGLLIEVGQHYVPGRGSDLYDWLADSAGVLTYFLWVYVRNKTKN